MVQVGWPLPACVQCMHGLHVRAFVCPVCVWRRGGVRMQQQPRPAHCREAAPGASPPTTTFSSLDSHTPHRSTHPTPPTSPPQDLRMVKDYFMDGVQVKIWKGYVEGERALHGGGGGGGCSVCVCVHVHRVCGGRDSSWGVRGVCGGVWHAAGARACGPAASSTTRMSDTLIWGRSRARSQALRSPVPPPPAPRPQAWPPPSWSPATATSGRARSTQTSGRTGRGGRAVEGRRGASCLPLRQRRGLCVIQQKCVSPLPPPRLPPCLFPAPRAHHNPSPSPVPSSPPLPPGFTTGAAAPWSTSSTMRTRAREWRARTRAMMTCVVVSYDEFCVVVLGVGPPSGSVRHVPTLLWFCCVVCCVCYGPTTLCPACGLLPTPLPPPPLPAPPRPLQPRHRALPRLAERARGLA